MTASQNPPAAGSRSALWIALCGIAALIACGLWRTFDAADSFHTLVGVTTLLYVLWILSEFRITAGQASQDTREDGGTCERYAIARFITMFTAFVFPSIWSGYGPWLPIGAALCFAGVALRIWAIRTLGSHYSHRVRTPGDDGIVRSGPYRVLRHPAYAGMLLAHLGILVLFFNWFLLVALCAVFVPALVLRIRVEEAALLRVPAYAQFAATRARLVPGLW